MKKNNNPSAHRTDKTVGWSKSISLKSAKIKTQAWDKHLELEPQIGSHHQKSYCGMQHRQFAVDDEIEITFEVEESLE